MARISGTAESGSQSRDSLLSCRELERLVSLQQQVSRKYFRLAEAHRVLQQQSGRAPRNLGAILSGELERERQRLARELHTGVGQALAGIHLHLGTVQELLPDPPERVRRSLDHIESLASRGLEEVRNVSQRLYASSWQAHGLVEALRRLWESSGIPEKFAGVLELQKLSREPLPNVSGALYRAAQEGISNVIRHADARHVRLALRQEEDGRITLDVEDDGSGFAPPADLAQPAASAGIGLRSMRDLARTLGGDLKIQTGPQGTKLTMSFPVIHE